MVDISFELLPGQRQLVESRRKLVAFVGGFGSGKTHGAVVKATVLGLENAPCPGIFVQPTYTMIRDVAVRSFTEFYREHKIPFHYRANDHVMTVADSFDILFRSGDRPELLIGTNAGWAGIDEPAKQDEEVAKMLLGRIRHPKARLRQLFMTGTPEGHNWFYEWCEDPNTEVIRARTRDNPYLDPDYVRTLVQHLTPDEQRAYLDGEFVRFDGTWFRGKPRVLPHEFFHDIKIFLQPGQTSGQLLLGVDTGGGLDRDSSSFALVDRRDRRLVASWKDAKATIEEMCDRVALLVARYTTATPPEYPGLYQERVATTPHAVVEVNGIGRATYQALIRRGIAASEVNTTEATRYQGLLATRREMEAGVLEGPSELVDEVEGLLVKDGKFVGPKDLAMAIGFAYNWLAKNPYVAPKSVQDRKVIDMMSRLGRRGSSW